MRFANGGSPSFALREVELPDITVGENVRAVRLRRGASPESKRGVYNVGRTGWLLLNNPSQVAVRIYLLEDDAGGKNYLTVVPGASQMLPIEAPGGENPQIWVAAEGKGGILEAVVGVAN